MLTNNSRLLGRARLLGRSIFLSQIAATAVVVTLAVLGNSSAAQAKAMTFESSPVTDAVAQINRTFNAHVVIKPGVNSDALVTFTVPDIADPGARIDAINDLANALKADYTKSFVISIVTADEPVPDPVLDAPDAPVVISGDTVDASDVIKTIAHIDDASVQFYSPVHGTVSISDKQMTASDAAREVARQTHTIWKAVYAIAPRSAGTTHADGAQIIGYTASGSPITELPTETFRAAVDPEVQSKAEAAKAAADASKAAATAKADAPNQADQAPIAPYNYGYYSPYDFPGNYGYAGYGGYGSPYNGYGNGYGNSGYPGYGGYGGAYNGYGNGYGNGGYNMIGPGTVYLGGGFGNGFGALGAGPGLGSGATIVY